MSESDFRPRGPAQPWQLQALGAARLAAPEVEEVILPTAEELEAMQEQARQEGHELGYREGLSRGSAEGQTLLRFADAFQQEIVRLDEAVAAEVATLAMAIAQRVLGVAFRQDPTLVARLVEQGLRALPGNLEAARIQLHPADLAVVEQHLGQEFAGRRLRLIGDASVSRGGCRIGTQSTEIDASLESRWQRVTEVLGGLPWQALPAQWPEAAAQAAGTTREATPGQADAAAHPAGTAADARPGQAGSSDSSDTPTGSRSASAAGTP